MWTHEEMLAGWRANVTDKRAVPHRMTTREFAVDFFDPIDVLYVDASHAYNDELLDLKLWVPKVRVGGFVLVDDHKEDSVSKAITDFLIGLPCVPKSSGVGRWGGGLKDDDEQFWLVKDWE